MARRRDLAVGNRRRGAGALGPLRGGDFSLRCQLHRMRVAATDLRVEHRARLEHHDVFATRMMHQRFPQPVDRVVRGRGQVIDLPLLDPMYSVLGPSAAVYKLTQKIDPRIGSRSNTAGPRNVFPTKDGRWISMSASMQVMVNRLYTALGVPEMLKDPRFLTNADRVANADAVEAPIRAFISTHTLEEGMAFFEKNEITYALKKNI